MEKMIVALAELMPLVVVSTIGVMATLWLLKDKRNKNEWEMQDGYLNLQFLKRYPVYQANLKLSLEDQGDANRVQRKTISR